MARGYDIIDFGLIENGLYSSPDASLNLSYGDQTHILSYIAKSISEIVAVPQGCHFEVIPVSHHYGPYYPCIGMYADENASPDLNGIGLSIDIADEIETYVQRIGVGRLLELSAAETLCWQDVMQLAGTSKGL